MNGNVKSRLFIYLGKSHFSIEPQFAYLFTTTTKFEYYSKNGVRKNNSYLVFKKGEYCFNKKCILDIDSGLNEINLSLLENNNKIVVKDKISEVKLKEIYSLILNSSIAKVKKIDIHSSYNYDGITGLKRP